MDAKILLDEEITPDGDRLVRALLVLTGTAPDDERRTPLNLALVLDLLEERDQLLQEITDLRLRLSHWERR